MEQMTQDDLARLRAAVEDGGPIHDHMARHIGERSTAGGFWRFFSLGYPPPEGLTGWNSSEWRRHWPSLSPALLFFGEDLLGNQLGIDPRNPASDVVFWNHEDGAVLSLELDALSLLDAVAEAGVDWLDCYADGSPQVALNSGLAISPLVHLHWVKPLILGGLVNGQNLTLVEREPHLIGHGQLWAQIGDVEPGTEIVFRPG